MARLNVESLPPPPEKRKQAADFNILLCYARQLLELANLSSDEGVLLHSKIAILGVLMLKIANLRILPDFFLLHKCQIKSLVGKNELL